MELPELEVWRREMERDTSTRKITSVEVGKAKWLSGFTSKDLTQRLEGAKVSAVERRGPWLVFKLATGAAVCINPSPTTTIRRMVAPKATKAQKTTAEPPPPADLTLSFTQTAPIGIADAKNEACLVVCAYDDLNDELPELATLGMDVVSDPVSWVRFGEELIARSGRLKSVLMDQTFVVGIGTCYSDEILYAAGLRYDRTPQSLSAQEIRRIYRSLVEVMHDAVKYGGTSLTDDDFRNTSGERGGYAEHLSVYKRDGEPSRRSRGKVVKARFGQGYTYFCESTQM